MLKKPTKEEIDMRILKSGVDAKTDDVYIKATIPMVFYCSKGHNWSTKLGNVTHNHQGCPYCSGRYPVVGETDLWTTNKEIASLLLNKNDGYKYMQYSSKKVDFVCPTCGKIINRSINNVSKRGLSCPICGDGISYPNKFMASMLSQLGIDFIPEFCIDGANYRYDFYVPHYSLIIEMQGRQHYEDWNMAGLTFKEVQHNDKLKLEFALSRGIKQYVCIDSIHSDINYISSKIRESKLNDIFNLSYIDWKQCGFYASGSLVRVTADLYNDNYTINEISSKLNVSNTTVRQWLKKATELRLCNWIKSRGFLKEEQEVILLNTKERFCSMSEAGRKYNVSFKNISENCNKHRKYAGIHPITGEPMVWRRVSEYDENEVIDFKLLINPHVNYSDNINLTK